MMRTICFVAATISFAAVSVFGRDTPAEQLFPHYAEVEAHFALKTLNGVLVNCLCHESSRLVKVAKLLHPGPIHHPNGFYSLIKHPKYQDAVNRVLRNCLNEHKYQFQRAKDGTLIAIPQSSRAHPVASLPERLPFPPSLDEVSEVSEGYLEAINESLLSCVCTARKPVKTKTYDISVRGTRTEAFNEFERQRECNYYFARNLYYAIHKGHPPEEYPDLPELLPLSSGGGGGSQLPGNPKVNVKPKPANNIVSAPKRKIPASKPKSVIVPGPSQKVPAGKPNAIAVPGSGSGNPGTQPMKHATSDWRSCMQTCVVGTMQRGANVLAATTGCQAVEQCGAFQGIDITEAATSVYRANQQMFDQATNMFQVAAAFIGMVIVFAFTGRMESPG